MRTSTPPAGEKPSHEPRCGICYDAPSWRILAERHPNGATSWLICHDCKALVRNGKWDLLALRKLRAWELHEDTIADATTLVSTRRYCAQIRLHMTSLQPLHTAD